MTPDLAIAALDRGIAISGTTVTLRRRINGTTSFASATCRAVVRFPSGQKDLPDGVTQQFQNVVFSPTDLLAAGFPGAAAGSQWPETGDLISVDGVDSTIQSSSPISMNDRVVRIECQTVG